MIWTFILAHFLGDYALQSNKMVELKKHWSGLLFHISVHVIVLFALTWGAWPDLTRYILMVAVIHFAVDAGKTMLARIRPEWVIAPYLIDQVLHFLTIFWVVSLMPPDLTTPLAGAWQKTASVLILLSQAWFITERILFYGELEYVGEVNQQLLPRTFSRLLIMGLIYFFFTGPSGLLALAITWSWKIYPSKQYRLREILLDFTVGLCGALLLLLPY